MAESCLVLKKESLLISCKIDYIDTKTFENKKITMTKSRSNITCFIKHNQ